MKTNQILIIFFVGFCIEILGEMFRLLHYPYGQTLKTIGIIITAIGAVSFLYKSLFSSKTKNISNQ